MDIKHLTESLHSLERGVIPHLESSKSQADLIKKSRLSEVEVSRALQWLDNKGVIKLRHATQEIVSLGANGTRYAKIKLPELRFLNSITSRPSSIKDISIQAGIDATEANACLGALRQAGAILIDHGMITITPSGKSLLSKPYPPQAFIESITSPRPVTSFTGGEQEILSRLKARKDLVEITFRRITMYTLTPLGKQVCKAGMSFSNIIDLVTPETLAQGSWKGKAFRRYDVAINVPSIHPGRRHHYKSFLDYVRHKFATLGFTEMHGPLVENEFWDMDSLFMPQFHSARAIHQAYPVKEPATLPVDSKLLARVKACHERGGSTGSTGWQYAFDAKRSQQTLLRSQGTACSARMLASTNLRIPGKYFGITKNFRYDVIDATHLPDFFQTEGIVVEEGLTFGHLKGILKLFAQEFAHCDTIKLKPAYFPFTEPSVELHAKHPQLGWIELGGAGMFRPELLEPFNITVPVIAWGMGIDRIGMFNLGITDIRDLYTHNLEKLRTARII